MKDELLTFQRFSDPGLAAKLAEKLAETGINAIIVNEGPALDTFIIGTSSMPDYSLKILSSDFVKAQHYLEDYYSKEVGEVDADYYLFSFTEEELLDIMNNPSEWGPFDFQLAKKILKDKGITFKEAEVGVLSSANITRQAKKENGRGLIIIAYIFTIFVALAILLMFINKQYNFPYSIFLAMLASSQLAWGKKTLPNGEQVWVFNEKERITGKNLFFTCLVLLAVTVLMILLFTVDFAFAFV